MATQCILCQKNQPIQNSHVVPKFVIRYLKRQSPMGYLKQTWNYNQKLQDGWKGAYLCAECDNVTVSEWEDHFKKTWFDPFIKDQKSELLADEKVLSFLLSLLLRYCELFIESTSGRRDSYLPVGLQKLARGLLKGRQYERVGSDFYIYSAFIHPITDKQDFLPGINQLLFNSYNGILLPPEGELPCISVIWIPSFLFLFSEKSLESIKEVRALNLPNSLQMNIMQRTSLQNWGLLYLIKGILNRQINNMNVSQSKQRKEDFDKLKETFQKDQTLRDRMSYKARNWDQTLGHYLTEHGKKSQNR